MSWKTLDDMNLDGKRVLTRVDINVPVKDGVVTDPTRIERIVPTIHAILQGGGTPILVAHFGRPKGKIDSNLSLRLTLDALEKAIGRTVKFADASKSDAEWVASLGTGEILLLENIRFHTGETENSPELAQHLSSLADIYCNDAFSAAHRAHASTTGVAKLLPSCAGRLMQAELEALETALSKPKRPVVAVVGGAKVSTKLTLLGNLIEKTDSIVIGGGMANTFLAAQDISIGTSLCEYDLLQTARDIMAKAREQNCALILPTDVVCAKEFAEGAENRVCGLEDIREDEMILDAGPNSIAEIMRAFSEASTIVWNGPLGAFEIKPFNMATDEAAKYAAQLTRTGKITSVAGGGDTVAALNGSGAAQDFTYISTAGGAFLEWLEGKTLPGVEALG